MLVVLRRRLCLIVEMGGFSLKFIHCNLPRAAELYIGLEVLVSEALRAGVKK